MFFKSLFQGSIGASVPNEPFSHLLQICQFYLLIAGPIHVEQVYILQFSRDKVFHKSWPYQKMASVRKPRGIVSVKCLDSKAVIANVLGQYFE